MARAEFRDYVFPLAHPQVARLKGKDAHAHARIARGDPRAQELLIEPWSQLITEPFTGITTDGTPIQGLFDLVPDDAPVTEMVSAARRLLDDEWFSPPALAQAGWPRSSATSTTPTSAGLARRTASIPSTTGSRAP